MGLFSFLKRPSGDAPKAAPSKAAPSKDPVDAVQQARTRARQRLIGAAVLVVAGVIGFPMIFATQPRPLPVDTPIDIARRDTSVSVASSDRSPAPAGGQGAVVTETPAEAGREVAPPEPAPAEEAPVPKPEPAPTPEPARRPEPPKPAPKPVEKPAEKPAERKPAEKSADKPAERKPAADANRAQALLNGQDAPKRPDSKPADESAGRFIVQVGAFSEMNAAREARQKVEKLGLKTYTQVVETSSGNRIRVRVGPFANRAEADKAAGKIKSAGLGSAVYTL